MFRNAMIVSLSLVALSLGLGGCATGVEDDLQEPTTATQGITGVKEGIDLREHAALNDNALNPRNVGRVVYETGPGMKNEAKVLRVADPKIMKLQPQFGSQRDLDQVTAIAPQFVPAADVHEDPAGQL